MHTILSVIKMKNSKEILSSIMKTTQMGQIGIRSVLKTKMSPSLRDALESQLEEYDSIEKDAHAIAAKNQWTLPEINPSVRIMTDSMTRMRLSLGRRESKIAVMMIRGNTAGIIKGVKNHHHAVNPNHEIMQLSTQLINTEEANIRQMKSFL